MRCRDLAWAQATASIWLTTAGVVLGQGVAVAGVPGTPWLLVITLEGLPEDVAEEEKALTAALRQAGAPRPVALDAQTATGLWARVLGRCVCCPGPHAGRRARTTSVGLLANAASAAAPLGAATWLFDVAAGLAYAAGTTEQPLAADWVAAVRQPALALGGYGALMLAPPGLTAPAMRWGYRPDALALMERLKARWDPAGILNPGVFGVG